METVADAFKGLAATVNSRKPQVTVKQFSDACSLFSGLFGILDTSFKFAKMDYVGKVFFTIRSAVAEYNINDYEN